MKHTSIIMEESPIEFINITPLNPLISKCQIKVCYVSDQPNRNKSIITKDVAKQLANSLPGSPIVGKFTENGDDFEEHNRLIKISNGKFTITDDTRPYGFVDLNAKVWFQKFVDDGTDVREYLMTEGYIWTGQYPESQRIIEEGNNQSMELDEKTINATWTRDINGKPKFFIVNEAIISKLCILGEDYEPCFEGSTITAPIINFSFNQGFEDQMFYMMNEIKEYLTEGGEKVFTTYAVEIGDALWSALYGHIEKTYPGEDMYCSAYSIDGIFEENGQKFAVLRHRSDMKYYRLNFSLSEEGGFTPADTLIEVTKSYTPAVEPQFAQADVEAFEATYAANQANSADNSDENNQNNSDNNTEEAEVSTSTEEEVPTQEPVQEEQQPEQQVEEPVAEPQPKETAPVSYILEEIPEYVELQTQYSELEQKYNDLVAECETLKNNVSTLGAFKLQVEKKEKEAMINSFYMLSEDDKKDVIENIDTYSLEDIESKLSVICVRNKVKFDSDENENGQENSAPTTYTLNGDEEEYVPAWVKRALEVAKNM